MVINSPRFLLFRHRFLVDLTAAAARLLLEHEFEEQKQTKEFEIIDHYNSKLREPAQFTARLDQEPYK